ncbi:MAG: FAD-binding oxidoreductase [Bacteroidia bacterium]|jgi:glycine/D-amino acid oxidase-like deaminating enzyme|nr:FAD-binding oxidoreductase [Bacteroidia bacterium]
MLSFWEQHYFTKYDFIIIGAGITGLSTACAVKEKNPRARVLVLERGLLPTGASTKNAGFACIGSFTEKRSDLNTMGEAAFLQLVSNRIEGLYMLRKRLGDDNIDYIQHGGFELLLANQQIDLSELEAMNKLLEPLFKGTVFYEKPEWVAHFGFDSRMVKDILFNPFEAQLDTGKMMQTLLRYAGILQVTVLTGANVLSVTELPTGVDVEATSAQGQTLYFKADQVAHCTNAFATDLVKGETITPGRGQVICTSPIPNLPMKGVFSFDEGYYYFRNIHNRIIFGGGRNLDFEQETTTAFGSNETILKQLEFYLAEMILPNTNFTIEYQWSGIMAFGPTKLPIVKRLTERQVIGARLNGMGVALGSKIADQLSHLLLG